MRKVILIQGPNTHPEQIVKCYSGHDVIFSTLEGEDTSMLEENNFIVVKNKRPEHSGHANFNLQVINTLNGIKKAEELGYDFVFKVRSDITIPKISKLLDLMGEPDDTIFFPAYHNWDGGYLCEHMLYGKTNLMKILWDIPESTLPIAPEIQLTTHFKKKLPLIKVDYIFPLLYKYDIFAYWEKRSFFLNNYENDKLFTYGDFKK